MLRDLESNIQLRLIEELRLRNYRLFIPQSFSILLSLFFTYDLFKSNLLNLVPVGVIFSSLILRYSLARRGDHFSFGLFLFGVSLTGLGWGGYIYLTCQHFGLISIQGCLSLSLVATLLGGSVTTLSASRLTSALFMGSLVLPLIAGLLIDNTFESRLAATFVLLNFIYHLYHSGLSFQATRSVIEKELKEAAERKYLQHFIDGIPGLVSIVNDQGEYELVNNYEHGKYRELITPHLSMGSLLRELNQDNKDLLIKEISVLNNDQQEWFMVHARRVPYFSGMAVSILPITELVRTRDALRIQEMKAYNSAKLASLGEVAAGIAHEVNNPLTIIEGAATIMNLHLTAPEPDIVILTDMNKKVLDTTQRIHKLVKSLKKLSRNEDVEPLAQITLQSIIEPSLEILQQKIVTSGIELRLDQDFTQVKIEGREVELGQVLMNLVANAIDAVEGMSEKWIQIKYKIHGQWCDIFVTDSGPGISPAIQEKVMQPFFTTKDPNQGTGLGLSISKNIVEKHFGELSIVEGQKHTTFRVRLPLTMP